MVKHTQTNCLSMFDDFVGLALKKLVYLCRVRLTLFWNLYKSNNFEKATKTKSIHLGISYYA